MNPDKCKCVYVITVLYSTVMPLLKWTPCEHNKNSLQEQMLVSPVVDIFFSYKMTYFR